MATNTNPELYILLPQFLHTKTSQSTAKQAIDLLKTAKKRKMQTLHFQEKVIDRWQAFYTWFDGSKIILSSQEETADLIQNKTDIISFEDPDSSL